MNYLRIKENASCSNLVDACLYDPTCKKDKTYPLKCREDVSTAIGSGSIISTTADLLKWNLDLHKYKTVLPEPLYSLFITPYLEDYGYGVSIIERDCGKVYKHDGAIDAYKSYLLYIPDYDLSIIYLSNITYDWDKVDSEYEKFYHAYQDKNLSEKKCDDKATEKVYKKYPGERGYNSAVDDIDYFLD